ncbi:BlaI/MecI/CopY family transcriptional regulator [Arachidicoccus soli]|uniref:BlaI/MecI/CopY family transcriptional regulator n=1 Tax=Arachidicoccus soli TaxID=2341117 RepID=A0A386HKN5_9BACT|nr:BlaI/MecI/CopY family transcriptional regulator [Arachidicoccus soli]AYD46186.1 BlaI/MecI/CopY family transcriptional regulator [Arachidicoccus soli]
MQNPIKPTNSELEILQILWEKGPCSVREVHEILEAKKAVGYTTTLKLMQIMCEKNILARDVSAKTHVYKTAISQKTTQRQAVQKMIQTMFKGSPSGLVMQALGNHNTSKEELDAIRSYLNELENSLPLDTTKNKTKKQK